MILYFANREMQILGQASTILPNGFVILDDLKSEDVDTGVATFECKIGFDKENRLKLEGMTNAGNYLLRSDGDENEFYTIIDSEIDTKNQEVYIYAEDAGLDLLNEVVGAFEATESHTAEWYINKYTNDSGFEIGINEIPSTSTRKLSWDGEATATERLASIATQFGGYEISFSFAINGMEVSNKYINIYKERGKSIEEPLMLNRDIDRIITKKSVANLATAFLCTGGIPKGKDKPITLEGYEYDDGDFYVSGKYVKSREAVNKWSRYVWNKEPNQQTGYAGHIVRRYTYDTTSQKTLCSHAITELKKICDMEVNYEVDINRLPDTVRIGDRVNIVDDAGELYLSARILKFDKSAVNKSYKATLGEYLIKDSGISQKVEDLAAQFAELAANRTFYTWIAYADDETGAGISLDPAGKEYMGTAANQASEEVDISDPSIFKWSKIKGEQGEQGIPGTNGTDGKTSYFHIKYSSVSNPTSSSQMTETPSEYIGTYVDYTSTDSTDPSKYTWARFQGLQGETGEQGIPGTNGSDGKTSYLHIKYSNDGGSTFTSNNGETAGDYIGQYVDYTQADSTSVSAYTWSKIKGDTGRGTQNVTRYYILQSSTAAAPSKPTTNPPPSGWTDTEPTYTSGSTNSLYFCDLMVFSDGTWAYSEVSKSSSYEAAKEAYNKAAEVSDKTRSGFIETLSGSGFVQSTKTEDGGTAEVVVYGKSVQDGTPTPDVPVEIQSVESPKVTVCGTNVFDAEAFYQHYYAFNQDIYKVTVDGVECLKFRGPSGCTSGLHLFPLKLKPNTQYVISYRGKKDSVYGHASTGIGVAYSDGTLHDSYCDDTTTFTETVFTTYFNKTITNLYMTYNYSEYCYLDINSICIREVGTEVEPYKGNSATLSDIILRSIPDGTRDRVFKDSYGLWKIERNVAEYIITGNEYFNNTYFPVVLIIPSDFTLAKHSILMFCTHDKGVDCSTTAGILFRFISVDTTWGCSSADELKNVMTQKYESGNPVKIVYEVMTPTYETLPDSIQAELNALTTYNPVTNVIASDGVTPDIDVSFWTRDHAAKEEAAAAAKVATNFMGYDGTNGLLIGNKTSGEWSGYRSQMLPTAFNILDANGNTLSSFGANDIELGLNNDDATINLCNGQAMLKATGDGGALTDFMLYSDKRLVMRAYRSALINCYRSEGYYSQIHVDSYDPDDTSFNGQISLRTYGLEKGATLDVNHDGINLNVTGAAESDGTIRLYRIMEVNRNEINANADFNLLSNTFYGDRIRCMFNGHGIAGVDSSGNQVNMMYVGTTDILNVGGGSAPPAKILVNSTSETRLETKNAGVMLDDGGTSTTYDGYFHPTTDNKVSCGRTSYRWTRVYAANSSISTSDKRQKKNIKPIKERKYKKNKNKGKVEEVDLYSELFDKFQPCEYEFIEGEQRVNFGLIAQDVLEAMAELGIAENELDLVHHDIETVTESRVEIDSETGEEKLIKTEKEVESFGLAYENIIAMLINEVQNLKAEVYKTKKQNSKK